MAQSLQIIAFRIAAKANQKPVWNVPAYIELQEGVPTTILLSKYVTDPDPEYPGAKPLEINVQSVLAALAGFGIQVVDLGRDVEIRYDGRSVGAKVDTPLIIDNAFVGVADDGVPDNAVVIGGVGPTT